MKNDECYTNGGRVINVVGIDNNLKLSISKAYELAKKINFEDKYYRMDIGSKALKYFKQEE